MSFKAGAKIKAEPGHRGDGRGFNLKQKKQRTALLGIPFGMRLNPPPTFVR